MRVDLMKRILDEQEIAYHPNMKDSAKFMDLLKENGLVRDYEELVEAEEEFDEAPESPVGKSREDLMEEMYKLGMPVNPKWTDEEIAQRIEEVANEEVRHAMQFRSRVSKARMALDDMPKAILYVPLDTLNPKSTHAVVKINGVKFRMKRGEQHEVPVEVARILNESMMLTAKALEKIQFTEIKEG